MNDNFNFNFNANANSSFLDLTEIIRDNKKQENKRLDLFASVLKRCHELIKRKNKMSIKQMTYQIPIFIMGQFRYDVIALRNYIYDHLRENGLKVQIRDDQLSLYISWDEKDINIKKFMHRKAQLDLTQRQMVLDAPGVPQHVSEDTMFFRQNKQLELQRARQQRFEYQRSRFDRTNGNYESYIKRY